MYSPMYFYKIYSKIVDKHKVLSNFIDISQIFICLAQCSSKNHICIPKDHMSLKYSFKILRQNCGNISNIHATYPVLKIGFAVNMSFNKMCSTQNFYLSWIKCFAIWHWSPWSTNHYLPLFPCTGEIAHLAYGCSVNK